MLDIHSLRGWGYCPASHPSSLPVPRRKIALDSTRCRRRQVSVFRSALHHPLPRFLSFPRSLCALFFFFFFFSLSIFSHPRVSRTRTYMIRDARMGERAYWRGTHVATGFTTCQAVRSATQDPRHAATKIARHETVDHGVQGAVRVSQKQAIRERVRYRSPFCEQFPSGFFVASLFSRPRHACVWRIN